MLRDESYYAISGSGATGALDPIQFAALIREINTGREMSCEKWSRLSTGKANSVLCYLGVLPPNDVTKGTLPEENTPKTLTPTS